MSTAPSLGTILRHVVGVASTLPPDDAHDARKRRSGIEASIEEGMFAQVWITLTSGKFLADLALWFGAASIHLGIVNAIPFFAAPLQMAGAYLAAWVGSRRRVLLPAVAICRQSWWLILALVLLPLPQPVRLWGFIALFAVSHAAGAIVGNTWLSWMADLIPERIRGRVIARRNGYLFLVVAIVDFVFSEAREIFGKERPDLYLALMLAALSLAGLKTIFVFRKQWEPPHRPDPPPRLRDLVRDAFSRHDFRQLVGAMCLWNISVGIAVSFWSPYMMNYLGLRFTTILLYHLLLTGLSFLLSYRIWGKIIDKAGTLPVILTCGAVIAALPFLFLFMTPDRLLLYWVDGALSGMAWSGFNAAIFALPIQIAPHRHRPFHLALFSGVTGIALGVGALLGGVIAQSLETWSVTTYGITYINYHVVFVLSGFLRGLCLIVFLHIPDRRSRGVAFMMQVVGDGAQKAMTSPRLVLLAPHESLPWKRSKRRARSAPAATAGVGAATETTRAPGA